MVPLLPAEGVTVQVCMFAEQFAFEPPFDPAQVQVHGPLPLTVLALPALQRLLVGAVVKVPPLDEPHWPLTGGLAIFAEQLAVEPPFDPAQVQVHGPVPLTVLALPALQRLLVGAAVKVPPLDEPHWPLTGGGGITSSDWMIVPVFPTATKLLMPYATPLRAYVTPVVLGAQVLPLEVRMRPPPAATKVLLP